jgi:hypothetical protein
VDDDKRTDPEGTTDDSAAELAALRAENEALRAQHAELQGQLAATPPPKKKSSGVRTFFAWLLAILAVITIVLAVDAVWVQTTLTDTDTFVDTLDPLLRDEAVAEVVAIKIAEGVVEATELEARVGETLPAEIAFLAAPITGAIRDLTSTTAQTIMQTDAFGSLWNQATRVTHTAVSAVLSGNDGVLEAEGGSVSINLDTIAEPVVDTLGESGLDLTALVGEDFTLGSIELYQDDSLAEVQAVAQGVKTAGWLIPLIALVLIVLAIVVAADRRRMVAILGFGTAIGMLVMLVALRLARRFTVGAIEDELSQSAGESAWDIVLRNLTGALWAVLFLGLVVGFVAWLAGPSERAGHWRAGISGWFAGWREPVPESERSGISRFLADWRRPIEWAIVGLGLLFLLLTPTLTLLIAVITVVVVGLLVAGVELIAGPTRPPAESAAVVAQDTSEDASGD